MGRYTNANGEIGVVISVGYGAGWSTWAFEPENAELLMFHPQLVDYILHADTIEPEEVKNILSGINDNFFMSLREEDYKNLTVVWVKKGEMFYVEDYDGYESIVRPPQMFIA